MAELKKNAKKLQRAGQATEPEDSILAHISPEEAMMLRAAGGSGEVDPKTGLPHFNRETDRAEHDTSKDKSDSSGDKGGGGGGGGGGNDSGGNDTSDLDAYDKAMKEKLDAINKEATSGKWDHAVPSIGGDRGKGGSDVKPSQASFGTDTQPAATPVTTTTTETSISKKGIAGALAAGFTGNIPGAVASLIGGRQTKTFQDAAMPEGASDFTKGGTATPREANDKNDGDPGTTKIGKNDTTTPAPVDTATTTPETLANDLDSFTRGARRKKGLSSTIVSGGSASSGISMGKSLLGM